LARCQSRCVADFLLAWHNADENSGWNPVDLWCVDRQIADDILNLLKFIRHRHLYPAALGFREEFEYLWLIWRKKNANTVATL
jgi:hypothetical protein